MAASTDSKKSYEDMSTDELRQEIDKIEKENAYQDRGEGEGCEQYRGLNEQERLREKIIMDDIRFRRLRPKRRCKPCEGGGHDENGRRCGQCDGRGYPRDAAARRQHSQRETDEEREGAESAKKCVSPACTTSGLAVATAHATASNPAFATTTTTSSSISPLPRATKSRALSL